MIIKVKKDEIKTVSVDKAGKYVVELVGERARVEVVGRFEVGGKKRHEVEVEIRHKAENTEANMDIRGVVRDKAEADVRGMIKVFPGAQKTNSFLTEKVLLLSDKARAEVVPNLEIEADDVKCSHAVTVGKIDEEQLFYLMSRGLERKQAEKMIIDGFLQ